MHAFFSKADDQKSEAIKQAAKEALNANKTEFETMKAVAKAYSTKRECSVQEAVYHILPEYFQKYFFDSNMPEKRYRIFKKKCQIAELPEVSTEIFQCDMLDRHVDHLDESFQSGM